MKVAPVKGFHSPGRLSIRQECYETKAHFTNFMPSSPQKYCRFASDQTSPYHYQFARETTMQRSNPSFSLTLASWLVISCATALQPAAAEAIDTNTHEAHHAQAVQDWPGIYNGFLPCDDCIGIKTSLALNKNGSYVLITQNVGKSPRDFVEKGKFAPSDKEDVMILTSRDGSKTHRYEVGEDMLTVLDDQGKRYTGKLAERYILRRTDVTGSAEPSSHSGH